jgi:hypothetical protein
MFVTRIKPCSTTTAIIINKVRVVLTANSIAVKITDLERFGFNLSGI